MSMIFNVSEKSNFIWKIADLLRGDYKQSEYDDVILPFTVLCRLDSVLAPTKKKAPKTQSVIPVNEASLLKHISKIIESRKNRASAYANREVTLMYWEISRYIGSLLLGGERAEYGKKDYLRNG